MTLPEREPIDDPTRIEDAILDAALVEFLSGPSPPDLAPRILQALAQQATDTSVAERDNGFVAEAPPLVSTPVAPPVQQGTNSAEQSPLEIAPARPFKTAGAGRHRAAERRQYVGVATITLGLSVALVAGYFSLKSSPSNDNDIDIVEREAIKGTSPDEEPSPEIVAPSPQPSLPPDEFERAPRLVDDDQAPASPTIGPPAPLSTDAEMVAFIDTEVAKQWSLNEIKPSPSATDLEWVRRVYLGILGRIPTVEELEAFLADSSDNSRELLVDKLLTEEPYSEEYARNWAEIWTEILIGRTGGTSRKSLASRGGLFDYLQHSFRENKPYDQLATELITATGSNKPGTPNYNGAVNFLLDGMTSDATLATARTSRVFLGQQVQCAQCHTHPFAEVAQSQFWELNAFFRQSYADRKRGGTVDLVNRDFPGESPKPNYDDAAIFFESREGRVVAAYPKFIDGVEISPSGWVDEVNRREALAGLVIHSDELPRALVNRVWSLFLGHGFTTPIDDMGPHNAPSHPELIDHLSEEFVLHDHDLKSLMRWIVLSEPFGLSSRIGEENGLDDPLAGSVPLFSRYYTRQMRAEEVYDSLVLVGNALSSPLPSGADNAAREAWLGQFAMTYNTDEGGDFSLFDGSVPQSLMMMNGPLMRRTTRLEEGSLLHRVIQSELAPADKIEHLFLAALSRPPKANEARAAEALLRGRNGDVAAALQDIWWALLNSNEFILDH